MVGPERIVANPLVRKLEAFAPITEDDKRLLEDLTRPFRDVAPDEDLIREGDPFVSVRLIVEGFAYRYKLLADGTRHIIAYLLPGDFCDLHGFVLKTIDHNIATFTHCKVVDISHERILALTERPALARAFWWATLVDEAVLREWLVNIGSRSAEQRVAHLLCEMLVRLQWVGLAKGSSYEMPITQNELADTMGLSSVHVSRVIKRLREEKLITLHGKRVVILDIDRLNAISGFNPNYLHINHNDDRA